MKGYTYLAIYNIIKGCIYIYIIYNYNAYIYDINLVGCEVTFLGISQKEIGLETAQLIVQQVVCYDVVYLSSACDNNNTKDHQ